VLGDHAGVEGGGADDLLPPEEVHAEAVFFLVLVCQLADVLLQVDVIRCSGEYPEVLKFGLKFRALLTSVSISTVVRDFSGQTAFCLHWRPVHRPPGRETMSTPDCR
jgi:hypothetical protein